MFPCIAATLRAGMPPGMVKLAILDFHAYLKKFPICTRLFLDEVQGKALKFNLILAWPMDGNIFKRGELDDRGLVVEVVTGSRKLNRTRLGKERILLRLNALKI